MKQYIDRMKGQDYIDKTREYLEYIEEHLNNVKRAFSELTEACKDMPWVSNDFTWHSLRYEIERHDLSKFSKEEFVQYRDFFFPTSQLDKDGSNFDYAWENHKIENHHHHETANSMIDLVHMVIDWTAMGYKFGDTAQEYYESNQNNIILSEKNKKFIYEIFNRISALCAE